MVHFLQRLARWSTAAWLHGPLPPAPRPGDHPPHGYMVHFLQRLDQVPYLRLVVWSTSSSSGWLPSPLPPASRPGDIPLHGPVVYFLQHFDQVIYLYMFTGSNSDSAQTRWCTSPWSRGPLPVATRPPTVPLHGHRVRFLQCLDMGHFLQLVDHRDLLLHGHRVHFLDSVTYQSLFGSISLFQEKNQFDWGQSRVRPLPKCQGNGAYRPDCAKCK